MFVKRNHYNPKSPILRPASAHPCATAQQPGDCTFIRYKSNLIKRKIDHEYKTPGDLQNKIHLV